MVFGIRAARSGMFSTGALENMNCVSLFLLLEMIARWGDSPTPSVRCPLRPLCLANIRWGLTGRSIFTLWGQRLSNISERREQE